MDREEHNYRPFVGTPESWRLSPSNPFHDDYDDVSWRSSSQHLDPFIGDEGRGPPWTRFRPPSPFVAATRSPMVPALSAVQIPSFSGSPLDYVRFMQLFNVHVAAWLPDDNTRLLYLIQHCTGDARRAIEDCVLLPPDIGYQRAQCVLRMRFGREQDIAAALIASIARGPAIGANDPRALTDFAIDLARCQMTLAYLGNREADSVETLRKVAQRLPLHLRTRWCERAVAMTDIHHMPQLRDFQVFVEDCARVANSVFAADPLLSPAPKPPSPRRAVTYATSVTAAAPSLCPCGKCANAMNCDAYALLSLRKKYDFCRKTGICFGCLRNGHIVSQCRAAPCNVNGCTRKHHVSLHGSPLSTADTLHPVMMVSVSSTSGESSLKDPATQSCAHRAHPPASACSSRKTPRRPRRRRSKYRASPKKRLQTTVGPRMRQSSVDLPSISTSLLHEEMFAGASYSETPPR